MNENLINIRGLKTHFYTDRGVVKAVDGVSLDVKRGETLGLVGESGCGKSQLALSILRLTPFPGKITEGQILLARENLLEKSEEEMRRVRGGRIAMVFQDPKSSLNPIYTVGFQLAEAIKTHQQVDDSTVEKRVTEILWKVGIPNPEKRQKEYPHELSGGMRQRVMIAMALSCNPELLIADEPTTNLDVTIQAQILDLMKQLKKDFGSSILLITHDLGVIAEMCDRVAVMYAGKIVELSDVRSIFKEHIHPYTEALLESIPTPYAKLNRLRVIPGRVPQLIDLPSGCRFHPRCQSRKRICKKQEPELANIGQSKEHLVACNQYTFHQK